MTAAALQALADRHLEIVTAYGTYRGRLVAKSVSDRAVTVLFAIDGADAEEPLVIALDDIRNVRPSE